MKMLKFWLIGGVFYLNGCASLQWYDSPIPVKVDLSHVKTPQVQKSATSENFK